MSMEDSMTESLTLLNATMGFLGTHLALIHIPIKAYSHFTQPILQLLLPSQKFYPDVEVARPSKPWASLYQFINISISRDECSIVCPREQADELFAPIVAGLEPSLAKQVSISQEDYSVITIGGEGLEAGQRVLDLTTPLALAGIPIFFITSYWSDFILVPLTSRPRVIHALEDRGFIFESTSANGDMGSGNMTNIASPVLNPNAHSRNSSSSSSDSSNPPGTPGTPPPKTISDLQTRTFKLLKRHSVTPTVDPDVQLVTCAGLKASTASSSSANFTEGKLHLGLIRCLTLSPPPRFLSLTLTDTESASLTLEKKLLPLFPEQGEEVLLGKEGESQVVITLDLHDFEEGATGIVCGVASRLVEGMRGKLGNESLFNMAYLSTARAGHVIVYEDELKDAVQALKGACGSEGVAKVNGTNGVC